MKKIIYLLITLLTVTAVLPYTVKAEESKKIISKNLIVTEPVEGAKPATTATMKYSTKTETIEYKDIEIKWFNLTTDEYLTDEDVYEKDNSYSVEVVNLSQCETDLESKGYTLNDDDFYINNKSQELNGFFYIGAIKELSISFENVVVGKAVKDAKVIYLIKDAEGQEHKFVLTNLKWLEYGDEGFVPVDNDATFKSGVNYNTEGTFATFEEGSMDLLMQYQAKMDINTVMYFNGKLVTGVDMLVVQAKEEENPNTLDNVSTSIILGILSLTGLVTTTVILRKKTRAN